MPAPECEGHPDARIAKSGHTPPVRLLSTSGHGRWFYCSDLYNRDRTAASFRLRPNRSLTRQPTRANSRGPRLRTQPGPSIVFFSRLSCRRSPASVLRLSSSQAAAEGVAHVRVAALEAAAEPLRALGCGAVRKLVGANLTRHLRLHSVVTNG